MNEITGYDETNETFELLAILFLSHGSRGTHLLFKYPYSQTRHAAKQYNFSKI